MEHHHSEHPQDGMSHTMREGHDMKGSKGGNHTDHHAHMAADFRKRFWISLILTLPILVLSPLLQKLVGVRRSFIFPAIPMSYSAFLLQSFGMVAGRFSKGCSRRSNPVSPG